MNMLDFNDWKEMEKQDIYLDSDIFLQLSLCEGTKFKIHKLLHTSSCNLELKKTKFNTKNPIILGNWDYGKKGKHIVDKLKNINSLGLFYNGYRRPTSDFS